MSPANPHQHTQAPRAREKPLAPSPISLDILKSLAQTILLQPHPHAGVFQGPAWHAQSHLVKAAPLGQGALGEVSPTVVLPGAALRGPVLAVALIVPLVAGA